MLCNDVLVQIAFCLDFRTVLNFSACSKNMRKLINPMFWKAKLQRDYSFQLKKAVCSNKEAYKFIATRVPQQALEKASALGWLEFVVYYVECFKDLDLQPAMKQAYLKKRKNVMRYFVKTLGLKPMTHFELYAVGFVKK